MSGDNCRKHKPNGSLGKNSKIVTNRVSNQCDSNTEINEKTFYNYTTDNTRFYVICYNILLMIFFFTVFLTYIILF